MISINPYLNFKGNCEEAFNFYKSVFGGDFTSLQRYKDVPSETPMSKDEAEWIMHVALPIYQGYILMGSDSPAGMGKIITGNNVHISISTESGEDTERLFNGLSADGQVSMPLQDTFWGARFGMLVDKFGIQWMINQENGQQE